VELPPVEPELEEKLKEAFKKIYGHTFQNALIRCDFFRHGDRIYLNEINPIPGSLAHYLFDDFEEVLERLAKSVELEREIEIDYRYIHQIQRAKGK
jgi:D-alanine-D-alanine ligase